MTQNLKQRIEMYVELKKEVDELGDSIDKEIMNIAEQYLPKIQERLAKDDQVHDPSICNTEEGPQIIYQPNYETMSKLRPEPKRSGIEIDNSAGYEFDDKYISSLNEKVKDIYQEIEQKHGVKVMGICTVAEI